MKFDELNAGDKILMTTVLRHGFSIVKTFMLPQIVDRVTDTQFVVGNRRFYREDGRERTSSYNGARCEVYSEENDQSRDYVEMSKLLQKRDVVRKLITQELDLSKLEMSALVKLEDVLKGVISCE